MITIIGLLMMIIGYLINEKAQALHTRRELTNTTFVLFALGFFFFGGLGLIVFILSFVKTP